MIRHPSSFMSVVHAVSQTSKHEKKKLKFGCHSHPFVVPQQTHIVTSLQSPGTIPVAIVPLRDNAYVEIQAECLRKRVKAGNILR